jgi:hypothetical protein
MNNRLQEVKDQIKMNEWMNELIEDMEEARYMAYIQTRSMRDI